MTKSFLSKTLFFTMLFLVLGFSAPSSALAVPAPPMPCPPFCGPPPPPPCPPFCPPPPICPPFCGPPGLATVEFGPDTSDYESLGGNAPVILVSGFVPIPSIITLTVGGTADGVDYSSPLSIPLAPGPYAATPIPIPLAISDDADVEGSETIVFGFAPLPPLISLGPDTSLTYTINNDDATVEFEKNITDTEGNLAAYTPTLYVKGDVIGGPAVLKLKLGPNASTIDDFPSVLANDTSQAFPFFVNILAGNYDGTTGVPVDMLLIDDADFEPQEIYVVKITDYTPVTGSVTADAATSTFGDLNTPHRFRFTIDDDEVPFGTVNPYTTLDTTPPLTGTVADPTIAVDVTVNGVPYPAINNGDGTWTLPDDTVAPLPINTTYDVTATFTALSGLVAIDPTDGELRINYSRGGQSIGRSFGGGGIGPVLPAVLGVTDEKTYQEQNETTDECGTETVWLYVEAETEKEKMF